MSGTDPGAGAGTGEAARIEVAAAVITRADGSFLLAQRPSGKVYAGYWEFPGGKVEQGEAPDVALARELNEELGIQVERAHPWLTRDYDYAHAAVRLRFYRVVGWSGEPHGRENQRFEWQRPGAVSVEPMLPANDPVLRALTLPDLYGITHAAASGADRFSGTAEAALANGLRLVQVREKSMAAGELECFAGGIIAAALRHHARVLVNGDVELALRTGAHGVHLTSAQLRALKRRPALPLVAASCHDERELALAITIGADFVVLGPVLPTPSHPGAPTLGWGRFARLVRDYPIPVYALGGMSRSLLQTAWDAGAHGIAMMRGAWQ